MSEKIFFCYHCGSTLLENQFGRRDSCDSCGRDTRVCKNCRNYDTHFNNACKESQAARQVEKEKANFCEWFQPTQNSGTKKATAHTSADTLKQAAEALFKKK